MKTQTSRWARSVALLTIVTLVASCGVLPRLGPTKKEIYSGSVQRSGDAFVVSVNDRVTRATAVQPALGFTEAFKNAGQLGSDTIRPGDTLGLTIWENVDDGLLAGEGTNQTILEEVQVDGSGFIFVPYAGRIRAAGNTPEGIRRIITSKLDEQTPDPQVQVRRLAGDGSTVSLVGSVGAQGVYPIERPTRTLSTMLSNAGGIVIPAEVAQITVLRGDQRSKVWFQDLYKHPEFDIALRGGDRILVEEDSRSFTALGATGAQSRVTFDSQTLSAIEAIATVGGLQTAAADPTGVFILRNEPAEIANQVLGRNDLIGDQRMVYVLDLTRPNGMFMARDFSVRDQDTLYVTEAPFAQWSKVISAITGSLGVVGTVDGATTALGG
ncbi:polysaccharide biosynthesis/export family protein [Roseovarius sp. LXJ103]|uniref:polysaccharide biosynthesis/export family protein n=1 Tax=Roseovarius carneus TaxID=2853164 RepID=UPI000D607A66|nr:polysaccharide biosynthesis/export family protein [Roseovarius carneus]MBZ8118691.1 polysaccharide biosynthesis/export family protein [Roseovarius carneus]PWE35628.1 sugar ABC transporter substrate-binding protein [Pelagicola sp. LXJ1103]